MATHIKGKGTKDPFLDGFWCCERQTQDKNDRVNREKIKEATFEETVYFRFKVEYMSGSDEFIAKIKESGNKVSEKTATSAISDNISKIDESLYIEEFNEKKESGYKVFELIVDLKKIKEEVQKNKIGSELILYVYFETTKAYSTTTKPFKKTLPKFENDYLNVGPPIRMVKLRVQVLDGVTGEPMKKEKVASISIENPEDVVKTNALKMYFNGWEEQINNANEDEKYSCESVQKALNRFYQPKHEVLAKEEIYQSAESLDKNAESFDAMRRLYYCGKVNKEFNTAQNKNAYNNYLKERKYNETIKDLGANYTIPPLNVRKLIVDEYNGMCMTDDNGYLYISIPVDKFLNNKKAEISIEFRSYYSFFEKIKNDPVKIINTDTIKDLKLVQRDSSTFGNIPKKGETGFKFTYSLKNEAIRELLTDLKKANDTALSKLSNFWIVEHGKEFTAIKNKPSTIINTDKIKIEDYTDLDTKKELEKDYSVFFKKEKNKNNDKQWVSKNYPLNKISEGDQPHLTMFLMTYWDSEEQGKYWIDTLNKIHGKTKLLNFYRKKFEYEPPTFGDGKIHMIAIRRRRNEKEKKRPNDIFVVVKEAKLVGVFYGSTEPGKYGYVTMSRGQHTNYTIAIIWDWVGADAPPDQVPQNAPILKPSKGTLLESGKENSNIYIHYGTRGFEKFDRWVWYDVGRYSTGCQIICGSHNIQSDGKLYIFKNLDNICIFRYDGTRENSHKLGAYKNFYSTYTDESIWNYGISINKKYIGSNGLRPDPPITYTLIDESDLASWDQEKFYYLYRKKLFFRT